MLFSTGSNEVPEEGVRSVLEVRGSLGDVIGAHGIANELVEPVTPDARLLRATPRARWCDRRAP